VNIIDGYMIKGSPLLRLVFFTLQLLFTNHLFFC